LPEPLCAPVPVEPVEPDCGSLPGAVVPPCAGVPVGGAAVPESGDGEPGEVVGVSCWSGAVTPPVRPGAVGVSGAVVTGVSVAAGAGAPGASGATASSFSAAAFCFSRAGFGATGVTGWLIVRCTTGWAGTGTRL